MTLRLTNLAAVNWEDVDGYAVGHGIDLEELPLERFCNFIWWLFTRNDEHKDREKFRGRIWQPPVGVVPDKRSPWDAGNETKAFASIKKSLGG